MNKQTFTNELNRLHGNGDRLEAVRFFTITTRLGVRLSKEIIDANWSASRERCFGNNIYKLLEASADEETAETEVGFDNFEVLVADDITYAVDVKLVKDDRFIGSYVYNWTPSANAVSGSTNVQLYVPVKDVLVPSDENYLEAIQWAETASQEYPPVLS